MKINMKKILLSLLMILLALGSVGFGVAFADDDDYEERSDSRRDSDEDERVIEAVTPAPAPASTAKPVEAQETKKSKAKVEYVDSVVVVVPERIIVETKLEEVVLVDTDRDGLPDERDPFPSIAQIHIVEDKDNNGIVDQLEDALAE